MFLHFRTISRLDISHYDILYHAGSLQGVKHFYLTDRFILSCKNVQYTSYHLKIQYNTVLLFFILPGGIVYIIKQMSGSENQAICSTSILWPKNGLSKLKITSIPTSIKPTNHAIFTTFNTIKNHHYPTLKCHQSLIK